MRQTDKDIKAILKEVSEEIRRKASGNTCREYNEVILNLAAVVEHMEPKHLR